MLGWRPRYTNFEAGLQDTIAWYTIHRSWWETTKVQVEQTYAQP
ncbi:dTDP-glucose 46-dehydratase [Lactiplantibacillus plantarum]|nr:dTDP-glucose 46-dehydratase [Lactiplantibacillus plantarum]KZU70085.1 dTDP-glucose 4 6-dehydratase [Lactiplantibacillus plantarum]KZU75716.1 dTDP-glucose 4 6-dehydratase [Lactiplantibacillus plantarum]